MGIEEITVSLLACRKTTCREGTHTKTMKFLKDDNSLIGDMGSILSLLPTFEDTYSY